MPFPDPPTPASLMLTKLDYDTSHSPARSPLPLAEKTAPITGSSRSIGAAIPVRPAAEGANVVIDYANGAEAADEVVAATKSKGTGAVKPIQADVSSVAGTKLLVEKALEAFHSIDILVLNTAIMNLDLLENIDEADYSRHFDTNVKGSLFLTQVASPCLRAGRYRANTSRVLSKDLSKRQISANTISPGPVDTPTFRNGKTEQQVNLFASVHPSGRTGRPEDISHGIGFLAGPNSVWVSSQNIRVNRVSRFHRHR
ncbi:hypothetical protein BOTBODRAFT_189867 [Botryobasidium botryosum FD-172 SS1]|uniref:Ketoreductase (KR) domain-containing protein n=1 Tax=Botryobasidium botryosum (strain FD-172 SS1) TaxID=930990 RepID=A0A067MIE5_BOTB1|nr:hypothetical protein BOTBODRAFT_189867 [Botryobasidium botryosum FD-172 SS1]